MIHYSKNSGFVVITSVIILSVVLIIIAQTLSTTGYLQRHGILDFEFKELSYFVALSCADRAIFKLSDDLDYTGNETAQVDTYQCTISPFTTEGSNTIIRTQATVNNSTTKLKVTTDVYLNIVSFAEE